MKDQKWEDAWNEETPPSGHEKRMQARLDDAFGSQPKQSLAIWKAAAAIIIALGCGWFLNQYFNQPTEAAQVAQTETEAKESFPIDEATIYYQQSVDQQFKRLAAESTTPQTKELISSSMELIKNLETQYTELQKELQQSGDHRVAFAMINNYKKRIEILESLMQQIEYMKHLNIEENENLNV